MATRLTPCGPLAGLAAACLLLGHLVPAAQAVAGDAPLPEAELHAWQAFAAAWNKARDTDHAVEELRALLPGVTTGDVAWVVSERRFNEEVLADTHWTPEHLLLERPALRLAGNMAAKASALTITWRKLPAGWPDVAAPGALTTSLTEDQLWADLGHVLGGDLASLRSPEVPFKELLWVRVAQNFDTAFWEATAMAADELLSSPDYGLLRKAVADAETQAILADREPAPVGPAFRQRRHDLNDKVCKVVDAACRTARCRERVETRFCAPHDTRCIGNGGKAGGASVLPDCLETDAGT